MEIKIGAAKTNQYAVSHSGDCVELAERPQGGLSIIMADGQGSGWSARNTGKLAAGKAAALIADGARDGAAARAAHDYLYAMKGGKVSSTLTILSADLDAGAAVISRNTNCPVIMKTEYCLEIYDEEVQPIGVHKRMKPLMYQMPIEVGMILVTYSDGVHAAGKKRGRRLDLGRLTKILGGGTAADAGFIADSILDYALELDDYRAGDDMTVVVMGICEAEYTHKIRRLNISYPY